MNGHDIPCPIWGPEYRATIKTTKVMAATWTPIIDQEGLISSDRAGGAFRVELPAFASLLNNRLGAREKARLTTWLVDQRRQGNIEPIITDERVKSFESTGNKRDLPVPVRAERLLRFIAEQTETAGARVSFDAYAEAAHAWSESTNWDEVVFLLNYLKKRELLESRNTTRIYDVSVTVDGYAQIEELSTNPDSAQAFVAMWFDGEMREAYDKGIEPAIKDAGYKPMLIDRKQNVIKIDDEIIAEIRRSRFLVADMTHGEKGARGGVYFEAVFALGLGLPVLYSCREDPVSELHFDTRQYFHILWETPEELRRELVKRIGAVVGDGPLHKTTE